MFVLPLVVVFVSVFIGMTSEKLVDFFKRHIALVKFSTAGLFLLFAILMLL